MYRLTCPIPSCTENSPDHKAGKVSICGEGRGFGKSLALATIGPDVLVRSGLQEDGAHGTFLPLDEAKMQQIQAIIQRVYKREGKLEAVPHFHWQEIPAAEEGSAYVAMLFLAIQA